MRSQGKFSLTYNKSERSSVTEDPVYPLSNNKDTDIELFREGRVPCQTLLSIDM